MFVKISKSSTKLVQPKTKSEDFMSKARTRSLAQHLRLCLDTMKLCVRSIGFKARFLTSRDVHRKFCRLPRVSFAMSILKNSELVLYFTSTLLIEMEDLTVIFICNTNLL